MILARPVATVAIKKDGNFLLLKRADNLDIFPSKWTIPGGGMEPIDWASPKHGTNQWYNIFETIARREVLEECGLHIGKLYYVCSLMFIRPDNVPVVAVTYTADYIAGDVKLNKESTEFKWVHPENIHKYDLIEDIAGEIIMARNLWDNL